MEVLGNCDDRLLDVVIGSRNDAAFCIDVGTAEKQSTNLLYASGQRNARQAPRALRPLFHGHIIPYARFAVDLG